MSEVLEAVAPSAVRPNDVRPLTGNEAIARGAWEAGVKVAAAYPGTPEHRNPRDHGRIIRPKTCTRSGRPTKRSRSTSPSAPPLPGGARSAAMKHVGLNVAADAFMSQTYIGVNGGLVIAVCDDPGIHSSQNEQDIAHLRPARHRAGARAERRAGGARFHPARLRSVGDVRHAGDRALDDAAVAHPQPGGDRRRAMSRRRARSSRSRRRT